MAAAGVPPQTAGTPVCTITDTRINGATGLAVVSDGYLVIVNGENSAGSIRIFHLNAKCEITSTDIRQLSPLDPSDLALGTGGVAVIADFGDTTAERTTIALWNVGPNNSTAIYRM